MKFFENDLPADLVLNGDLAIDTEAMGLNCNRDRLCLIQIADSDGQVCLVKFKKDVYNCPNLKNLLTDTERVKIFHFARFDLAVIYRYLGINLDNIFCTRTASKLARTYTDSHSLKELCKEFLSVQISKQQQSSDWGADHLTQEQQIYASKDVIYLHELRDILTKMLKREDRFTVAQKVFSFLPTRAELDIRGWDRIDIFEH